MNESNEFSSPLATSTVWKKKRPENWSPSLEETFQQSKDVKQLEFPSNKENVDSNNSCDHIEESCQTRILGESTLNLRKYLIPAHQGELEEDSFIVETMAFKSEDRNDPLAVEESLAKQISENLNWDSDCSVNDLNDPSDPSVSNDPIPGFIITDKNVLVRRHSSAQEKIPTISDAASKQIRKILSAPPSVFVEEASPEAKDGQTIDNNLPVTSYHHDRSFNDEPDCEEDLVNESFSKYFKDEPGINCSFEINNTTCKQETSIVSISEQSSCEDTTNLVNSYDSIDTNIDSNIDTNIDTNIDSNINLQEGGSYHDPVVNEPEEDCSSAKSMEYNSQSTTKRKSLGSLNTIPYVDPDLSITTDALDSPDCQPSINSSQASDEDLSSPNQLIDQKLGNGCLDEQGNDLNAIYSDRDVTERPEKIVHRHTFIDRLLNEEDKLKFPNTHTVEIPCAVGIVTKIFLKIENMTDLWVQCFIDVDESGKESGLSSQNRLIVPPLSDEELPVCFCARQAGLCVGSVSLTINSVISGMLLEQHRSCKITAIAELPRLQVLPRTLDFGVQYEVKEASYELKNSSDYELPLKIVLESDNLDDVFSLSDPMSKYPTSVFILTLGPQQLFVGHIEFAPVEQLNLCKAKLKVYVDATNSTLLCETPITGTVGHYKIRIPKSRHALSFKSNPGVPQSITVPFRNTGNMASAVTLKVSPPFTVNPAYIASLVPGEDGECEVSYFPDVTEHVKGNLSLSLGGDDISFMVPIEAQCMHTVTEKDPDRPSLLLANKSIVNFGGSDIGRQKEEQLLLKNDSRTQLMCLELRVISPSKSFYILNDNISLSCDMVLSAGSSQVVTLGYTPLHAEQHMGELIVKCSSTRASFSIPLSGHGGLGKVSVENTQQTSSRLWLDMGEIIPSARNTTSIRLHNTGTRPAFVSGVLENEEGLPLPCAWINPSNLVIPVNSSREMYMIYEGNKVPDSGRLALLKLYCGEEIARLRYCRVLSILNESPSVDVPFDPTSEYQGSKRAEEKVIVPHLTPSDSDGEKRLFTSCLYQLFISVRGNVKGMKGLVSLQTDHRVKKQHDFNRNLQSPKDQEERRKKTGPTWDFSVQELQMKGFTTFHLVNGSLESLKYNISYEVALFSASPVSGCIPPCGCSEISIKPIATHSPFISTILVSAGGQEKTLKVVYSPESCNTLLSNVLPSNMLPGNSKSLPHKEMPVAKKSSMTLKELLDSLEVKPVVFKKIPCEGSTSSFLEFNNTLGDDLQWHLSSVAPAYVKVGEDVRRLKYAAFQVEAVSGSTPKGCNEKILVTFYPKQSGFFSQWWTLTYCLKKMSSVKQKVRLEFEGSSSARCVVTPVPASNKRAHDRVFLKTSTLEFNGPPNVRQRNSFKIGNPLKSASEVVFHAVRPPFYMKYKEVLVEAGHSARIPISFQPEAPGNFRDTVVIDTEHGALALILKGSCT